MSVRPMCQDGSAPLEGIRVLDFTRALAGPYCTMVLGDLGAEVNKVEMPGRGDETREWGPPFVNGQSSYFMSINRNKRSVALDLKSEDGLQVARDLAARSDVVVENFRPGTTARLGIGPGDLRALNERLVYCSVSGFGQDGPARAGYDQIVQGTAGLMSITGMPDGPPVKLGIPISDIVAGMFGAHAVLAALYERERAGKGKTIDVAMQDSVIALLTFQAGRYFATGDSPGREGNHHPSIAPYGMYETADGYVNITVGNDSLYRRFCEALEAPHLLDDDRFTSNGERVGNRDALTSEITSILRARTTDEWLHRLDDAGVPAGSIRTLEEVFADPLVEDRAMKVDVGHPTVGTVSVTGAPWKLDGSSSPVRLPPPLLGQHTGAVLAEVAGYDAARIEALGARGAAVLGEG
ncbi:MAG: CaiB/BaiF CoA transferase family protein [Actinomycetota bacterium]